MTLLPDPLPSLRPFLEPLTSLARVSPSLVQHQGPALRFLRAG